MLALLNLWLSQLRQLDQWGFLKEKQSGFWIAAPFCAVISWSMTVLQNFDKSIKFESKKKTKLAAFSIRQDRRWFYGGLCRVPNPADLACPISNKAPQLANFFTSTYQFVGKYNAIWTFYQSLWQNYPIYDNFLRFASSLNNSPRIWYSRPINLSEKAIPVWRRGWDPLKWGWSPACVFLSAV